MVNFVSIVHILVCTLPEVNRPERYPSPQGETGETCDRNPGRHPSRFCGSADGLPVVGAKNTRPGSVCAPLRPRTGPRLYREYTERTKPFQRFHQVIVELADKWILPDKMIFQVEVPT